MIRLIYMVLVFAGLLSSAALPPIFFLGYEIYFVTLISALLFLFIFLSFRWPRVKNNPLVYPFLMGSSVTLSSLFSWVMGYSSFFIGDLFEAIKFFQFIPYFFVLPYILSIRERLIYTIFNFAALLVIFVGVCQLVDIQFLKILVSLAYLGDSTYHLDQVISGERLTLTGSDPNTGAIIACFFCFYFFSRYLYCKKTIFLLASLIFVYLALQTQSRTSMLGLCLSYLTYGLFFNSSRLIVRISLLLAFFLVGILAVFFLELNYILIGFESAASGDNESLQVRLNQIKISFNLFYNSPFLGVGPSKSLLLNHIDSEYALIIQRYGLIGVFVFGSYIFYLFRLSFREIHSPAGVSLFLFTIYVILSMFGNNIFSGYQVMSLLVALNIWVMFQEKIYINSNSIANFLRNSGVHKVLVK